MRVKSSKRAASRNRMILALDDAARQIVFERDGYKCIRCSSMTRDVQWAHVLSRRHLCTRWLPENAMSLCAGCHLFWHHEPALAMDWFFKNFRERFEFVNRVLQTQSQVKLADIKQKYGELRSGA